MSLPANRSWKKSASKSKTLSNQFTRMRDSFCRLRTIGSGQDDTCATRCDKRLTSSTLFPAPRVRREPAKSKARIIISCPSQIFFARVEGGRISGACAGARALLRHTAQTARRQSPKRRGCLDRYRHAGRRDDPEPPTIKSIRQALCDVFIMPPDLDELRRRLTKRGTETPKTNRAAHRDGRARNGTLARLSLHDHQQIDGGRSAEVPPYHGRGTLS